MASQPQASMSGAGNQDVLLRRKKADRACDYCRRRKARCAAGDADPLSGRTCMNCALNQVECTFDDTMKVCRLTVYLSYIEALEARIAELQNRVTELEMQLKMQQDSHASPASSDNSVGSSVTPKDFVAKALSSDDRRQVTPSEEHQAEAWEKSFPPSEEFDPDSAGFIQTLKNLDIGRDYVRHMGRSSTGAVAQLVWQAIHLRTAEDKNLADRFYFTRRLDFWLPRPWEMEISAPPRPQFTFPDRMLLQSLVDLYFENVNLYFPMLHRPTFDRQLFSMDHARDTGFACILLLVCAIGSRYSDDPRVKADPNASKHSSGWHYFSQVEMVRKPMIIPPKLHDIQIHCLSIFFMYAASMVVGLHVWTRIGVAIRFAQDAGAHRRRTRKKITIEDELWNRCFWTLVGFDRVFSAILGRACAIQDEEFSIRYPMEVDDEYWDPPDPVNAWKQPPGKPAVSSMFVAWIKLTRIIEMTLRTIYTINRTQLFAGVIEEGWERQVIAELDSALNKWQGALPQHLRWNPDEPDDVTLDCQVYLHTFFSQAQILIHKPFITPLENSRPVGLPSLEICTSAARACAHTVDVHRRRRPHRPNPYIMSAISASGVVLVLSLWTREKTVNANSLDKLKEFKEINMCREYLKALEERWVTAGRFWDILNGLCHVHQQLGKRIREDMQEPTREAQPPQPTDTVTPENSWYFMNLMSPNQDLFAASTTNTPSPAASSTSVARTPSYAEWVNLAGADMGADPFYVPVGEEATETTNFAAPESWFKQLSTEQLDSMLGAQASAMDGSMDEAMMQRWADSFPANLIDETIHSWPAAPSSTLPSLQADLQHPLFSPSDGRQNFADNGDSERPRWF
ncbi:fungal-specific transcription factor domain-containing protein [Schizophyllum fasciatum]